MKLRILYISDLHSRFEELAKIASAIDKLKDKNTIILDCGDNADFMRLETEGTCGRISSAILNKIGFHARVFGNNEGFSGKINGKIIAKSSNFPVVTCNMYNLDGNALEYLEDSVIIDVSGLKVLIIGVTAPYNVWYELFEMLVKDPQEEITRVLSNYEKDKLDLVVLLSHLGLECDKEIASKNPNIDVIIGGHSHSTLKEPIVENQTIICQAGYYGEYLGELLLDYDIETRSIRDFKGRLIPSESFPPHPAICDIIRHYSKQANEMLSRKLYFLDTSLDHSLTEENAIGNLLADSLRDILEAEIGIINSGVLNKGLEKGYVTKKLLHEICPSPLNPTSIDLKGGDLLITLEKSLLKEYQLMDGKGAGFRGKLLGNIQVSHNLKVHFNPEEKPRHKIKSVTINGHPLDLQRWYRIGTSDYLQRGTGYRDLANSKNEKFRPEFLREVLKLYLRKREFISMAFINRFIPQA